MPPHVMETIGIRPSMIYKIKQGNRYPSFKVMQRIAEEYNWSVNEQVTARAEGSYAKKFGSIIEGVSRGDVNRDN